MVVNRTVKNYFPGSTLDIIIDLDTNHGGYFTFELCRRDSFDIMETESCFESLQFIDGSYSMKLQTDHSDKGLKSLSLLMPEDVSCISCVLRWNYRTGNNWGTCINGTEGVGCGPQELYRNCADISIGYQIHQSINLKDSNSHTLRDIHRKSMRKADKALNRRQQRERNEMVEFTNTVNNDKEDNNNSQYTYKPIE